MTSFRLGEFHSFHSAGRNFLYLVPSAAIFELEGLAAEVIERLKAGERSGDELADELATAGHPTSEINEVMLDLYQARAITTGEGPPSDPVDAHVGFPLNTLVLNVTNQCNLSCKYCYEFGEDKLANPEGKTKYMPVETAEQAIDLLLEKSKGPALRSRDVLRR
jgi:uncharacterized protein